jgi:hypothetical protein
MKKIPEEEINEVFHFWKQYYNFQIPKVIALILNSKEWKKIWYLRKTLREVLEKLKEEKIIPVKEAKKWEASHGGFMSLSTWMKECIGFVFETGRFVYFKELEIFKNHREFLDLIAPFKWTIVMRRSGWPLTLFEELTHIVESESESLILPENRFESEKILIKYYLKFFKWKLRKSIQI